MHYNCLIIDDEIELAQATCEYFNTFEVSCAYASCSKDAFEFLHKQEVDLILLDINLANESGFDLCKKIRQDYEMPILFISARQSDDDVLIALNIGGDDYIKKPYSLSVLLAKVKVVLKREVNRTAEKAKDAEQENAAFRLEKETFSVYVRNQKITLKAKEFMLLECLYQRKNTIVSKEALFDEVWGDSFYSDGTLNVHIRKLREKIEKNPNEPEYIKTIWGTGYMLELK